MASVRKESPGRVLRTISDRPIESLAEDHLELRPYAEAIVELVDPSDADTPFALAVNAPWGSGKTSLGKLVDQALQEEPRRRGKPPHITCWFNAWLHESAPNLGTALAAAVAKQADQHRPLRRRILHPLPGAFLSPVERRNRALRLGGLALVVAMVIAPLWVPIVTGVDSTEPEQSSISTRSAPGTSLTTGRAGSSASRPSDPASTTSPWQRPPFSFFLGVPLALPVWGLFMVWSRVLALARNVARFVDDPRSEAARGSMQDVHEELGQLVAEATESRQGKRKLVVFVDDLERCPPARALEICMVTSQLLDHRNVVILMLADLKRIEGAAHAKYADAVGPYTTNEVNFGRMYVEKILQFQVDLPMPTKNAVEHMIRSLEERDAQEATAAKASWRIAHLAEALILLIAVTPVALLLTWLALHPGDVLYFYEFGLSLLFFLVLALLGLLAYWLGSYIRATAPGHLAEVLKTATAVVPIALFLAYLASLRDRWYMPWYSPDLLDRLISLWPLAVLGLPAFWGARYIWGHGRARRQTEQVERRDNPRLYGLARRAITLLLVAVPGFLLVALKRHVYREDVFYQLPWLEGHWGPWQDVWVLALLGLPAVWAAWYVRKQGPAGRRAWLQTEELERPDNPRLYGLARGAITLFLVAVPGFLLLVLQKLYYGPSVFRLPWQDVSLLVPLALPAVWGVWYMRRQRRAARRAQLRTEEVDREIRERISGQRDAAVEAVNSLLENKRNEPLYPLYAERARRLLTQTMLEGVEESVGGLRFDYLPRVPRAAKRITNRIRFLVVLALGRRLFDGAHAVHLSQVVKWAILVERWPDLADQAKLAKLETVEDEASLMLALNNVAAPIPDSDHLWDFLGSSPKLAEVANQFVSMTPGPAQPGTHD